MLCHNCEVITGATCKRTWCVDATVAFPLTLADGRADAALLIELSGFDFHLFDTSLTTPINVCVSAFTLVFELNSLVACTRWFYGPLSIHTKAGHITLLRTVETLFCLFCSRVFHWQLGLYIFFIRLFLGGSIDNLILTRHILNFCFPPWLVNALLH